MGSILRLLIWQESEVFFFESKMIIRMRIIIMKVS